MLSEKCVTPFNGGMHLKKQTSQDICGITFSSYFDKVSCYGELVLEFVFTLCAVKYVSYIYLVIFR